MADTLASPPSEPQLKPKPNDFTLRDADYAADTHVIKGTLLSDDAVLDLCRGLQLRREQLRRLKEFAVHEHYCDWPNTRTCSCGLIILLRELNLP